MSNDIQVWTFDKLAEGHEIRLCRIEGEPWFCHLDVCKALGLKNASQVKKQLSTTGVHALEVSTHAGLRSADFINEPNLYELVFISRKPAAVVFRKWVCEEVLPAIRKHGGYLTPDAMAQVEQLVNDRIAAQLDEVKSELALVAGSRNMHTVSDWLRFKKLPVRDVQELSRRCKWYSKKNGYKVEKVNGFRYPTNAYNKDVLENVVSRYQEETKGIDDW